MKCSIDGCLGEYEAGKIMHTVRHRGQVMVIDHVPADICSVCGDVLLRPDTVRKIEALLQDKHQPVSTVPLSRVRVKGHWSANFKNFSEMRGQIDGHTD